MFHQQRAPLYLEDAFSGCCEACSLSDKLAVKQINRRVHTFPFCDLTNSHTLYIKHFRHTRPRWFHRIIFLMLPRCIFLLRSCQMHEASGYYDSVCVCVCVCCEAVRHIHPLSLRWRPLTRSSVNRCKDDWVISGWGGCRPPLRGRGEEVLVNRLVAMLMTHTFAGTLPNSSWITHCYTRQ